MNRNIVSVLLGGYGTDSTVKGGEAKVLEGEAQFTDVPSTVELLTNSKKVSCVHPSVLPSPHTDR